MRANALAFSSSGNLFDADNNINGPIYEFAPNGTMTTFATGLTMAQGMPFNSSGDLFVSTQPNRFVSIYEYAPNGTLTTFATGLSSARALAFDGSDDLFVADQTNNKIYEYAPNGTRTTFATGLDSPSGLAFSNGNLFESDGFSGNILEFAPNGTETTFATGLSDPFSLAFAPSSVPEANTVFDVLGGLALGGIGLLLRRKRAVIRPKVIRAPGSPITMQGSRE